MPPSMWIMNTARLSWPAIHVSPQSLHGTTKMVWPILKDTTKSSSLTNKLGEDHSATALCPSSDGPKMQKNKERLEKWTRGRIKFSFQKLYLLFLYFGAPDDRQSPATKYLCSPKCDNTIVSKVQNWKTGKLQSVQNAQTVFHVCSWHLDILNSPYCSK
jgi:hypothetical protein